MTRIVTSSFKDDKTKTMEERTLAAIDYYYSDGEPFEEYELLERLEWEPGQEYINTSLAFYSVLPKLVNDNIIKKKEFDTGEGIDMVIYWKNNKK